ncbi:MAG: DUF349 domain-containing protein [Bacteroidaceae bacterium]
MTDSNENLLNQETIQAEENATTETKNVATERKIYVTKADVLERLDNLAKEAGKTDKEELEVLKQVFYKNVNAEQQEAHEAYLKAGGDPEAYKPEPNIDEETFKQKMAIIKKYRAKQFEEQEKQKQENLNRKLAIIEEVKRLASTPEEANNHYDKLKMLQAEWREIRNIPADKANELWKNYQLYIEQFYDLLKQNSEMRAYDFKKNLEAKTHICELAEQLIEVPDVIQAFHRLQELHQEFREIGPVAKELREELWERFKETSSAINKRHTVHFEEIKKQEDENLRKKTALCEKMEAITTDKLHTFNDWDAQTKEIIVLQGEWKTIGQTSKKTNTKIFERFRAACDTFFLGKATYFKQQKETYATNLAQKTALCEKAESLKESEEWSATTNLIIQLQKDWKQVGVVPKKASDALWLRFNQACNYFFERKNASGGNLRKEQYENLDKKKAVIEKLKAIAEHPGEGAQQLIRSLMEEWNTIGHVPFKEKDIVYAAYHEIIDQLFKELNIQTGHRKLESFKSDLQGMSKEGSSLSSERNRMFRAYEAKKAEITTYENNMSFLTSSSKSGNSLVNEMQKKADRLKDDLELLQQKIAVIDEQIKEQKA